MAWTYRPRFSLLLRKGDGTEYTLPCAQSIEATLETGTGIGQMHVALADLDGRVRRAVQPHPMNVIQLWLQNRHGYVAPAWTGYIDTVQDDWDTSNGNLIELGCTSPVKLYEITTQKPSDVYAVKIASASNISGAQILQYASAACGYPLGML